MKDKISGAGDRILNSVNQTKMADPVEREKISQKLKIWEGSKYNKESWKQGWHEILSTDDHNAKGIDRFSYCDTNCPSNCICKSKYSG